MRYSAATPCASLIFSPGLIQRAPWQARPDRGLTAWEIGSCGRQKMVALSASVALQAVRYSTNFFAPAGSVFRASSPRTGLACRGAETASDPFAQQCSESGVSSYSSSNTFGLLQARPRDGALRPVESRIRQPVHLRARLVNGTQHFAIQIPVCSTLILSGWVARKHGRKFKRLLRRSLTSTARLCAAFYSGWYNSDCHQREVAPREWNAITRRGEDQLGQHGRELWLRCSSY